MLSETIANISQPMISQQICPNQVLSTKFSEPNLFNQISQQKCIKHNFSTIFLNKIVLNIFSTKFSQQNCQQNFLNKIFSTFSQHFLNKICWENVEKCSFVQKEAFSQHFLNTFSQHFSTVSQQIFLNKLFSTTFSQHFLNKICCFFGHTRGLAEWGKLKKEEKRN